MDTIGDSPADRSRRCIRIRGREIGSAPCLIVAEAGTAHGGRLEDALALIDAAAAAGADCVKFQAVLTHEIVHPTAGAISLPGGMTSIYESFSRVETDEGFYRSLLNRCEHRSVGFLCSPFGLKSARMLKRIEVEAVKIASPEINHFPLLDFCREWEVPCIVSTGVSYLGDIEAALSRLRSPTALLHCVTAYPAPPEDYNLRLVSHLASIFGVPVGVSDHTIDSDLVPVLAVTHGAAIVEKHITLSKGGGGLDDPVALTPEEFAEMVVLIRSAEERPDGAFKRLVSRYGTERVHAVLGDGVKRLAPSEAGFYSTTNRSILAVEDIARGEAFTDRNVALLRSETNIEPGIGPEYLDELLMRVAARTIPSGKGVRWTDIGERRRR